MNAQAHERQLRQHIDEIHERAVGVLKFHLIRPQDAPGLLIRSASGDTEAAALLLVIAQCLRQISTAPKRTPMLCAACPTALHDVHKVSFGIAWPEGAGPQRALSFGLCSRCAAPDKANASAERALREAWPDSRLVSVEPGGRA